MSRSEFARAVGISAPHLTLILGRSRGVSLDLAKRIESATGGEVSASSLPAPHPRQVQAEDAA
jgi:DNA-binding transcriptional regulator YdaS (Cro superfamily)